jgi:hypothetical protein
MGRVSCKFGANLAPGAGGGNEFRSTVVMVLACDPGLPAAFRADNTPQMTLFTRSLWPQKVRRPYLRLAAAIIAAPLVLAATLTLIAYLVAGATEATEAGTMAVTNEAAVVFFVVLGAFTLTFGVAGVAVLWSRTQRGVMAWLSTGAGAGVLAAAGHGVFQGGGIVPVQMAVATVLGLILFALIRWFAGVRAG